jgi:membrane protease subunit HflC
MSRPRGKRPVSQQSPIEILKSLFPSSTKAGTRGDGGDPMKRAFGVVWYLGAAGFLLYVALGSFTSIQPGQVAVRINNITGGSDTITQPGWLVQMPFGLHSVYTLDASPQTFTMRGPSNADRLNVKELTVRASDGSNFHFSDTKIIFRIAGDQAQTVIADAGDDDGFLMWMRPFARAILRDEFGRESTISVSNPAAFGEATDRAKERLNRELSEHGLVVTQIVTPRPQFNDDYEKLIEERNALGNQLEVIKSNLAAAETKRERRLAEVERDQNRQIQEKRTELEAALATAVSDQADTVREVDTYRMSKVGEGQAQLKAASKQAEELKGQLAANYDERKAQIDAFRTQPIERVMERLGQRLKGVTISIQPYADDSTPSRVRMEQIGR